MKMLYSIETFRYFPGETEAQASQGPSFNSPSQSIYYKNSSGDELANVNIFTTISHTYFKYQKKRKPTSFNKLDDS